MCQKTKCKTIAYTYTEPTIFYEYMVDVSKKAKEKGIESVMHSAGYINPEPAKELSKYIIAANIDLKGIEDSFYVKMTGGHVAPVLEAIKTYKENGVWIEITNLLIPGVNDSEEQLRKLCVWVKENLGIETPIHFSRFHPMYKLINLSPTPLSSLERAYKIAKQTGFLYVYIGNAREKSWNDTICPQCGKVLISRRGYNVIINNIIAGNCKFCGRKIEGIWS